MLFRSDRKLQVGKGGLPPLNIEYGQHCPQFKPVTFYLRLFAAFAANLFGFDPRSIAYDRDNAIPGWEREPTCLL